MRTSIGKYTVLIIATLLFSSSVKALENLNAKLNSITKLTPEKTADAVYQLTIKYIINANVDSIPINTNQLVEALESSNITIKNALIYEVKAHSAKNLLNLKNAKLYAQKGIAEHQIPINLLLRLLSFSASIETYLENYLVAIENYQIVEKILANNGNQELKITENAIGLADLYLKTGLYKEAIQTLKKGLSVANEKNLDNIKQICYKELAIVYYYLEKPDSLQYYTEKAFSNNDTFNDDSVSYYRLSYMKLLLKKDSAAINQVRRVINSPKDDDELMSGLHLAQAYVLFGQTEKAKKFILTMLSTGDLKNLTFLSSQLYKLMSVIYTNEKNFQLALFYYKKNVEQLTLYAEKQFKSDNILAILKYYEIQERFNTIEKDTKVRKNYFILLIIIAAMIILTFFLLYRALLHKKKFEKLAFDRLNLELSTINSHDVRKHSSNILGIINLIQMSEDKSKAYLEVEKALFDSVEKLDIAIKNISGKLNEYGH